MLPKHQLLIAQASFDLIMSSAKGPTPGWLGGHKSQSNGKDPSVTKDLGWCECLCENPLKRSPGGPDCYFLPLALVSQTPALQPFPCSIT